MMRDPASVADKDIPVDARVPVLIVGTGPAGIAAALEARRLGAEVMLVDENPLAAESMAEDVPLHFGSRAAGAVRSRNAMLDAIATDPAVQEAFDAGADLRLGTTCWGVWANGAAVGWLPGLLAGLSDGERSEIVLASRIVVTAGRRDMGLAFPGWERPGVMGVAAARMLAVRYRALDARTAILLGSATPALRAARDLRDAGVTIAAIVEIAGAPLGDPAVLDDLLACGTRLLCRTAPLAVEGAGGVEALRVLGPGGPHAIPCDTVLLGIAAIPQIELLDAAGCAIAWDGARGGHVPVLHGQHTTVAGLLAAGDCAGIWDAKALDERVSREEGRRAAQQALGQDVLAPPAPPPGAPEEARLAWVRAALHAGGAPHVCQCEEVTAQEILELRPPRYLGAGEDCRNDRSLAALLGAGPPSPDQVKRLTRAGMGLCQGGRCREQVAALLALGAGAALPDLPLATHRAPVRPLPLRLLAGGETKAMRAHWDAWFGIASQYRPFWDAEGTGDAPGVED